MKLKRLFWASGTVLSMVAGIVSVMSAPAYAAQVDLPSNTQIHGSEVDLLSITQFWAAGETHVLQGTVVLASNSTKIMLAGARVSCGDDRGLSSSENNTGMPQITTLVVNWIWTAPVSGEYTCHLFVHGDVDYPADSFTAQANGKTNLYLSGSDEVGSQVWSTADDCILSPEACNGGDDAVFVGQGLPAGNAEYVLHSTNTWIAGASTTQIRLQLDAELTTCDYGTGSCPAVNWGPYAKRGMDSAGTYQPVIHVSNAVTGEPCGQPVTGSTGSFQISANTHHKKVISRTYVPIPVGSDCRRFSAKLYLVVDPNLNPVKVEAANYSVGFFLNHLTA